MAEIKSLKNPLAERQLTLFRAVIAGLGVVALTLVLVGRLLQLQVVDHDVYATRSDDNRMRVRIIAPARCLVYDRNGIVLAENLPTYQLEIVPEQVEDVEGTVTALAELIDIPLSLIHI